jgi:hypothetical protein
MARYGMLPTGYAGHRGSLARLGRWDARRDGRSKRQFTLFNGALCTKLIVTRIPFPRALSTLKPVSTFSRKD